MAKVTKDYGHVVELFTKKGVTLNENEVERVVRHFDNICHPVATPKQVLETVQAAYEEYTYGGRELPEEYWFSLERKTTFGGYVDYLLDQEAYC